MTMLHRVPEPELMDEAEQARAYAEADFSEANELFVELFKGLVADVHPTGTVLDLGCGPADIPLRLARVYPRARFHVVDGSAAMLTHARRAWEAAGLSDRVVLVEGRIPGALLPRSRYDAIISNSLLHHLHTPETLWSSLRLYGRPGTPVAVMDLQRPGTPGEADGLVARYAQDAPPVLHRDFRNSLLAAFTPGEVRRQLDAAGLSCLRMSIVSDRHLAVTGFLP
jgi:ubiquinone/menaquinone biosynthesis C-methylase UbiE